MGKLRFPYFEEPEVSVVIPVYNQIHYTYACLLSILENTPDVSYEIIIADDVFHRRHQRAFPDMRRMW